MQIIDVAKDPYGRKYYAHKKRIEFNKLKRTEAFKRWKARQIRIQENRCAYCKISLSKNNIVTHIDHVDPLYYEGTNDFNNLVLSCKKCNVKKWIDNRVVKPDWVKMSEDNYPITQRLSTIRGQQKRLMKDLVERELDEQLNIGELSWLKLQ